jgi:hypothetical protein
MARPIVSWMGGLALALVLVVAACAPPSVKIAQRALEDRGTSDLVKDNEIVVDVTRLMATYETVAVSTEIYEQRLLVYGLLDDAAKVESFRGDVGPIGGRRRTSAASTSVPESIRSPRPTSWGAPGPRRKSKRRSTRPPRCPRSSGSWTMWRSAPEAVESTCRRTCSWA